MERTRVSCLWEGVTKEKGGETGQAWGGEGCVEGLSVGSRMWSSGERARPGRKRRVGTGRGCVDSGGPGAGLGALHIWGPHGRGV